MSHHWSAERKFPFFRSRRPQPNLDYFTRSSLRAHCLLNDELFIFEPTGTTYRSWFYWVWFIGLEFCSLIFVPAVHNFAVRVDGPVVVGTHRVKNKRQKPLLCNKIYIHLEKRDLVISGPHGFLLSYYSFSSLLHGIHLFLYLYRGRWQEHVFIECDTKQPSNADTLDFRSIVVATTNDFTPVPFVHHSDRLGKWSFGGTFVWYLLPIAARAHRLCPWRSHRSDG